MNHLLTISFCCEPKTNIKSSKQVLVASQLLYTISPTAAEYNKQGTDHEDSSVLPSQLQSNLNSVSKANFYYKTKLLSMCTSKIIKKIIDATTSEVNDVSPKL
jgi:hypothetical protein